MKSRREREEFLNAQVKVVEEVFLDGFTLTEIANVFERFSREQGVAVGNVVFRWDEDWVYGEWRQVLRLEGFRDANESELREREAVLEKERTAARKERASRRERERKEYERLKRKFG